MRKIKILYVIDCGLNAGGAPRSTSILADEMANKHEVYVLMPYTGEQGNPNIHYIQLKAFKDSFPFLFTQPLQAFHLVYEVYKVVKKIEPDIIHAEMPRGARALGLLKKMGLIKKPLIYTEREFVTGLRTIYQKLYGILVAKPYDRIVCLSHKSIPFWMRYRKDGVMAIPNPGGKDFDIYSQKHKEEAEKRVKNFRPDRLNIVFVGRYLTTKRWNLAEEIIKRYADDANGMAHFYIAIAYKNDDGEAQAYVDRLRAYSNVTIYPNADTKTMNDLYYVSDLHLITSSIESFGRTAIEAMARKNVVYSTDAGAISETIGYPEYILPPDAKCFVDVIVKAEGDRKRLDTIKEKMFERYHQLYSTNANYEANLLLYKELVKIG